MKLKTIKSSLYKKSLQRGGAISQSVIIKDEYRKSIVRGVDRMMIEVSKQLSNDSKNAKVVKQIE